MKQKNTVHVVQKHRFVYRSFVYMTLSNQNLAKTTVMYLNMLNLVLVCYQKRLSCQYVTAKLNVHLITPRKYKML